MGDRLVGRSIPFKRPGLVRLARTWVATRSPSVGHRVDLRLHVRELGTETVQGCVLRRGQGSRGASQCRNRAGPRIVCGGRLARQCRGLRGGYFLVGLVCSAPVQAWLLWNQPATSSTPDAAKRSGQPVAKGKHPPSSAGLQSKPRQESTRPRRPRCGLIQRLKFDKDAESVQGRAQQTHREEPAMATSTPTTGAIIAWWLPVAQ